jgi:uncharacterized LabA/DUF88 family protein
MEVNKKIALFIDCENISSRYIDDIMNELAIYGEVNICKAYGNWENPTLKGWKEKRFDYTLESIHQPPYSTNKNATDIKMTVDIMNILCQCKNNNISCVALATSDSDFTPLVIEIKSLGIQVIGFGEAKTNNVLQQACSQFLELNQNNINIDLHDNKKLIELLKNAVDNCTGEGGYALSSNIGTYLHNKTSQKAKNFGKFKTWGEILEKLHNIFEISFITINKYNDTKCIKLK